MVEHPLGPHAFGRLLVPHDPSDVDAWAVWGFVVCSSGLTQEQAVDAVTQLLAWGRLQGMQSAQVESLLASTVMVVFDHFCCWKEDPVLRNSIVAQAGMFHRAPEQRHALTSRLFAVRASHP